MTEEEDAELKVWMLEHVGRMAPGAVWRPDGTGLRYRKVDEVTLALEQRIDHEQAASMHERIKTIAESVNITVADDNVMLTSPALSPEEAFRQELQEKQAIATSWTTEDGTRLVDLPLEEAYPEFIGEREVLLDDGETASIDEWAIMVPHGDTTIPMNPDDYNLLAGDDLFMRYHCDFGYVRALTRQQMFDYAEQELLFNPGFIVGKTCPHTGVKVPPWMWGTYCDFQHSLSEEE